ncbi:MAG: ABC transporter ATP-binding protein [Thaumarchaeota archaeon]|nr:MAG: ABC transporter ATP-binding protein [Nitrososphaerota archaeon]
MRQFPDHGRMGNIIEVRNVSYRYRFSKREALKNISLEIEEGSFVGIIGPIGAGKTTLCYCLSGVIPHILGGEFKGDVFVKGINTRDATTPELTQIIGFCQQDAESQLFMTDVEREIAFPLENLMFPPDEIKARVEEALRITRLTKYKKRHPFFLSGGEKQRVVIAAVLAMRSEVIILDETLSELDPLGAEEVMETVSRLKEEGKTIIMVDHDLERLGRFADKIVLIDEGRKVAEGTPEEILSNIDLLREHYLDPPWTTQIAASLVRAGIHLPYIPITFESGVELFKKLLEGA